MKKFSFRDKLVGLLDKYFNDLTGMESLFWGGVFLFFPLMLMTPCMISLTGIFTGKPYPGSMSSEINLVLGIIRWIIPIFLVTYSLLGFKKWLYREEMSKNRNKYTVISIVIYLIIVLNLYYPFI